MAERDDVIFTAFGDMMRVPGAEPAQCKLFGCECTPEHSIRAMMVSSEGSCAAFYNYKHRKAVALGAAL